jgi:hypothetical protein
LSVETTTGSGTKTLLIVPQPERPNSKQHKDKNLTQTPALSLMTFDQDQKCHNILRML